MHSPISKLHTAVVLFSSAFTLDSFTPNLHSWYLPGLGLRTCPGFPGFASVSALMLLILSRMPRCQEDVLPLLRGHVVRRAGWKRQAAEKWDWRTCMHRRPQLLLAQWSGWCLTMLAKQSNNKSRRTVHAAVESERCLGHHFYSSLNSTRPRSRKQGSRCSGVAT
jgi:hypothetical protein